MYALNVWTFTYIWCLVHFSLGGEGVEVWRGASHLKRERNRTGKTERARRWLKTDRNICHPRRDEKNRVRSSEGWERDIVKKRGEETWREMKRGSGGIIMTKWHENDRSMGHVYPQERASERDSGESGGGEVTADWRVTLFMGKGEIEGYWCEDGEERWRETARDGEGFWL